MSTGQHISTYFMSLKIDPKFFYYCLRKSDLILNWSTWYTPSVIDQSRTAKQGHQCSYRITLNLQVFICK